jgi:hypothetical protein
MSTITPPPQTTAPPVGPAPQPSPGSASRVVAILAIVLGSVLVIGAVTSAVVGTIAAASVHSSTRTLAVDGVDEVTVDAAAGTLRVEFADVDEAQLEVTGVFGADRWRLDESDGSLTVASPDRFGPWFFGDWFFGDWSGRRTDAVLRLPASLQGLDADITLAAGEFTMDGELGDLELELNAGRATVTGTAEEATVNVQAGRGSIELSGVSDAALSVSAGSLDAEFTGTQPDDVQVDVSAGSVNVTVPDGDYDVTSNVSAGGFDNRIGSSPGASSTIRVEVAAGQVILAAR